MTTEQKAKAYDEALKRAKAAYGTGAYDDFTLEFIFPSPELAESEDERIREWLLDYAIEMIAGLESDISRSTYDGIKGHDPEAEAELAQWQKARACLEKQKGQKEIPLMGAKKHEDYIQGYTNGYKDAEKRYNESVAYHYSEPIPTGIPYQSPQCGTNVTIVPNTNSGTSTLKAEE